MTFLCFERFNKQFGEETPQTVQNILRAEREGKFSFYFPTPDNLNTSALIERIEKALPKLAEVVTSPYIILKSEYRQTRTELASNLTPQGIQMTVKDPKLWRMKDGKLRPEYVYSKSNEDEYDIYENRVIFALIDKALRALEVPSENARGGIQSLYDAYFQSNSLNKLDLLKLVDSDLFKASDPDAFSDYKKLTYLRGKLSQLRNSAFYKIMSQCPRFTGTPESTNLFIHNVNYHECFLLWRFLDTFSGRSLLTRDQLKSVYSAFVSLYMIGAYVKSGFRITRDVNIARIDRNFALKGFTLQNDLFNVTIDATLEKIEILVRCERAGSQQLTKVLLQTDEGDLLEKTEGAFVVSMFKTEYSDNCACVVPNNLNSLKDLESIVRCTVLTFEADSEIYGKVCPICGSNAIHDKDLYYRCEGCGAYYSIPDKKTIWLNRFHILADRDDD